MLLGRLLSYGSEFDRAVWIRFWGEIATCTAAAMVFPLFTVLLYDWLDTTRAVVGLIVGISPLAATVGSIVAGAMTDQWGRRRIMIGSLVLEGLFFWSLIWAESVLSFAVLIACQSFCGAFYRPAANAMVADVTPGEKRAQAYGLMRIAGNVGFAVGPLLGAVAFMVSPSVIFGITGTVLLLVAGFIALYLPETLPSDYNKSKAHGKLMENIREYKNIFAQKTVGFFVVLYVLMAFAVTQFYTSLPLYLKEDVTGSVTTFAVLLSLNASMVVVFQMSIARRTEDAPVGRTLAFGAALFGLGLFGFAVSKSMAVFLAMTVIFTIGEMYHAPSSMKYLVTIAPPDKRGRYVGLESLRALGMMTGPAVGGWLMDHFGGPSVFYVTGSLGLVLAWLYLVLGRQIVTLKVNEASGEAASKAVRSA
ncbi:MAG: MFS transporter [Peptococcaceae bacterium]|nr:MFS transporter [Peptococcaceae bacterium]